jgi:hypothetical protein
MGLAEDARRLITELRAEAALPPGDRGTRACDDVLHAVITAIDAWLSDPHNASHLAHLVTDRWNLSDGLSEQVVRFAHGTQARQ